MSGGWDAHVAYYREVEAELPGFWRRFGGMPDVTGKRVLELGCGHGALVNAIAGAGAARVVGVDLNDELIRFAREWQRAHHPELAARTRFEAVDVRELDEGGFDLCVSKATFEHILGLADVLRGVRERLAPDGAVYTGFGPLYYSIFGDHGRTRMRMPWAHALLPDAMLLRRANRFRPPSDRVDSLTGLGLNLYRPDDYLRDFQRAGFSLAYYLENAPAPDASRLRFLGERVMDRLKRVPWLRDLMTVNIWCVLTPR